MSTLRAVRTRLLNVTAKIVTRNTFMLGSRNVFLAANKMEEISKPGICEFDALVESFNSHTVFLDASSTSSSSSSLCFCIASMNICQRAKFSIREAQNVRSRLLLLIGLGLGHTEPPPKASHD